MVKVIGIFVLLRNPVQVTSKILDVVLSVQCGQSYWDICLIKESCTGDV